MQTFGEYILTDNGNKNFYYIKRYDNFYYKTAMTCPCSNKIDGFSRPCDDCDILHCKNCIFYQKNHILLCMPCITKEYAVGGEKYLESKKELNIKY